MKIKISEAHILAATRHYLQIRGWFVIRNQQSMGSHKGLSDLQAIKNGLTVYIETKRPGGKLSDHQVKFQEAVEGHGSQYIVIKSLDEIQGAVEMLDNEARHFATKTTQILNLKG
jgi:hypothetical protein